MNKAFNPKHIADEAKMLIESNRTDVLTTGEIAKLLGVGYERLNVTFHRWHNMSVADYAKQIRRRDIFRLLCDPFVPISEIPAQVGVNKATLHRISKQRTGMTPKQYREYLQVMK